ncbi:MAG TPA: kelch repeat-containing protein [Candidatus Limnocylindrales bacterium]|nr:kelch repeat-containing protein [Candidatus Limnocylindrales bacterium]
MPSARSEVGGAVLGRLLVVAGGFDRRETTPRVDALDAGSGTWRELAPLPEPRDHLALATLDGRLYAAGGVILSRGAIRRDLWRYDEDADRWDALAPMPIARYAHALVALDGRLWAVGGVTRGGDPGTMAVYDAATDAWSTDVAALPQPREHVAAVAADGLLWVLGGRVAAGNVATVDVYDPAADAWRGGPPMPTARSGHAAAVIDGVIHVTGGESVTDADRGTIPEHEGLDPASGRWETWPPMLRGRHGMASGVIEGRWILAGGGPNPDFSVSDRVDAFLAGD